MDVVTHCDKLLFAIICDEPDDIAITEDAGTNPDITPEETVDGVTEEIKLELTVDGLAVGVDVTISPPVTIFLIDTGLISA